MTELVEMVVESVRVHMPSSQHVVILKELDRERYLPIWIGPWEANAIAMKLQGVSSERPLTHDLFSATLDELGVAVRRVVISSLADETFHARLFLESGGREVEVDSRRPTRSLLAGPGRRPDLRCPMRSSIERGSGRTTPPAPLEGARVDRRCGQVTAPAWPFSGSSSTRSTSGATSGAARGPTGSSDRGAANRQRLSVAEDGLAPGQGPLTHDDASTGATQPEVADGAQDDLRPGRGQACSGTSRTASGIRSTRRGWRWRPASHHGLPWFAQAPQRGNKLFRGLIVVFPSRRIAYSRAWQECRLPLKSAAKEGNLVFPKVSPC